MKIQDILNQSKLCWKYAAMDFDKRWRLHEEKPNASKPVGVWDSNGKTTNIVVLYSVFDIEPFDGDWKDSLICREECGL